MSRKTLWSAAITLSTVAVLAMTACVKASEPPHSDALQKKVLTELNDFTSWLETNHARGYVGEVGWPDNVKGDADNWNRLADAWLDKADQEGLWVTAWATGEWWGHNYKLSMYENLNGDSESGVDTANSQASTFESHPATGRFERGVTVNGGEFGSPISARSSSFSNGTPGRYQTRYHYDWQKTFDYLARRDMGHVKIPFRWERVQPQPGGPLNGDEVHRLNGVIDRARESGLKVLLDMHNYGAYYLYKDGRGIRRAIGSKRISIADFADVWARLSRHFKDTPGILGYAIMTEPFDLPSVGKLAPSQVWERASQKALEAIRSTGDDRVIAVSGYDWSSLKRWTRVHPRGWIHDPANNFVYEAHHYWDRDWSGDYTHSYAEEVAYAENH